MIEVRLAECHVDTCLDVENLDTGHVANVNPVGDSAGLWRVDCDCCCTCIVVLESKREARDVAVSHVQMSVGDYQRARTENKL